MEKYANMIRILVTHVSYTELRNLCIVQYSSILELHQLSSGYSLYNTPTFSIFPYLYTQEHPASELCQQRWQKECKIDRSILKEPQSDNYWSDQNSEKLKALTINHKIFGSTKVG